MTMTWKEVQLGNVCDFQNGFAFKSELFHESGTPLLRISNIQNESVSIDRLVFIDPSDYKEDGYQDKAGQQCPKQIEFASSQKNPATKREGKYPVVSQK